MFLLSSSILNSIASAIADHLWQSTLFATAAGSFTLAFRKNSACFRYLLWLAASLKFLLPFSLFVALGTHFSWRHASSVSTTGMYAVEMLSQPFSKPLPVVQPHIPFAAASTFNTQWLSILLGVWALGLVGVLALYIARWWRLCVMVRSSVPLIEGREYSALQRLQHLAGTPIKILSTRASFEPGIFGVFRPVLLWPHSISDHLDDAHLEAIILHEFCHVRRRDNLVALQHMLVEAIFWFHPLVWWIGARLMEERERACDEEVMLMGSEPQVYAESILKICELHLESPLPCVSGVTGANLKKRIEGIMTKRIAVRVSLAKKAALAAAGLAALGLPIVAGISDPAARGQSASPQSARGPSPKFEVVSIKSCKPDNPGEREGRISAPGRLSIGCGILADTDNTGMIQVAYNRYAGGHLNSYRVIPIEGGPDWIHSERFEIDAKSHDHPSILMMEGPMMQTILEDRFKLKIHREARQGPVYELALGKGSPKLKPLQDGSCTPVVIGSSLPLVSGGQHLCRNIVSPDRGRVEIEGGTLSGFAGLLGMALDRPVIDKTGITGYFEIHLVFSPDDSAAPRLVTPEPGASAAVRAPDAPDIFQAIQEQLGLRLVPAKGPVDELMIDHIERPSEN